MNQYLFLIQFYFDLNFQEFLKMSKCCPCLLALESIYWLLFWIEPECIASIVPKIIRENPSSRLHDNQKITKNKFEYISLFSCFSFFPTNRLESFSNDYQIIGNSAFLQKKTVSAIFADKNKPKICFIVQLKSYIVISN